MESERRSRLLSFGLLPFLLLAILILAYFTFRATKQLDSLRRDSVIEATLALATEKAARLDHQIIEQDNAVMAIVDPLYLEVIPSKWLPTAKRETPSIRAILVLDENKNILSFTSRASAPLHEENQFRRLLTSVFFDEMSVNETFEPQAKLHHLHVFHEGQTYLISYWQKQAYGKPYLIVAWHDVASIIRDILPRLYNELSESGGGSRVQISSRINIVDEEGRSLYGDPVVAGEFTMGVPFPTTLYHWRIQAAPSSAEELATRVENRRRLEILMVGMSCLVVIAGVVTILISAERQRRIGALKGEFVANVSHELKTPLALIRMFSELLYTGRVSSEEKRAEYTKIIFFESERLTSLIENILDFAKAERGKSKFELRLVDFNQCLKQLVPSLEARAQKAEARLEVRYMNSPLWVFADTRAIEMVLTNLVDNALKYAREGRYVCVYLAKKKNMARLEVHDLGPGVPVELRRRIFERFTRVTKSDNKAASIRGSGIGLALVHEIAKAHKGKAWVKDSDLDRDEWSPDDIFSAPKTRGACFVVEIPARIA